MSFEANSDRSINGIYSLAIGVAVGTLMLAAVPDIFQHMLDKMNGHLDAVATAKQTLQLAIIQIKSLV